MWILKLWDEKIVNFSLDTCDFVREYRRQCICEHTRQRLIDIAREGE